MKKSLNLSCILMMLFLLLAAVCIAEANTDTITNWKIKITVPDGKTAVLEGDEYYIYGQKTGSIPYVMIRPYNYSSTDKFIKDFTDFMKNQYSDLKVTSKAKSKKIGDKNCTEIDYSYTVSGHTVSDRRIAVTVNKITYMFASKEIKELDLTIGNMLEEVIKNAEFLR